MVNNSRLIKKESKILEKIEKNIDKTIPLVDKIDSNTVGYVCNDGKITGLGLSACGLKSFPESITTLQSLKILSLSQNPLKGLPESFGRLKSLTKLYLTGTEIKTLPDSFLTTLFFQFKEGDYLDLKNTVTSYILEEVFYDIEPFNAYEMDFSDYMPVGGNIKHPFMMFHNLSVRNTFPPAHIIRLLFLFILEFPDFGEEDKVNWHTYFKYQNQYFKIRDYIYGNSLTWTIGGLMKGEDLSTPIEGFFLILSNIILHI